jgi:hypothetical protein
MRRYGVRARNKEATNPARADDVLKLWEIQG